MNYYTTYRNDEKIGTITDTLFVDTEVLNAEYVYKITAVDFNGNESDFSESVSLVVGVDDETQLPTEFSLSQNYPNPFNPTKVIKYSIPSLVEGHSSFVQLRVYDALGKEVATLVNEEKSPGNYEVKFNASGLSSGIYLYRITAGIFTEVKKMILMK